MEGRAEPRRSPAPDAGSKPKAAASLTADVVSRGRQRTQAYGEAGLWRGAAPPPAAAEAPVRVVLPPLQSRGVERKAQPETEEAAPRSVAAAASLAEPGSRNAAPKSPQDMGDVAFYLVAAGLVAAALYLVGMLLSW